MIVQSIRLYVRQVSTTNVVVQIFNEKVALLTEENGRFSFGDYYVTSIVKKNTNKDRKQIIVDTKNSQYIYEIVNMKSIEIQNTTYFGIKIYKNFYVKKNDIEKLPFYEFWLESTKGSIISRYESFVVVPLSDWELFSQLFIRTGKHRYNRLEEK